LGSRIFLGAFEDSFLIPSKGGFVGCDSPALAPAPDLVETMLLELGNNLFFNFFYNSLNKYIYRYYIYNEIFS
jgi:hypothetical protein